MNIDNQYLELLEYVLTEGDDKPGRNGNTKSIFTWELKHKMSEGFPLITTKKMAWHQIRTEWFWMMLGRTDLRWLLERNNRIWLGDVLRFYNEVTMNTRPGRHLTEDEFVDNILNGESFSAMHGYMGPIYGRQYRGSINNPDPDQIQSALISLKENPNSRRNIVNVWNPSDLSKMVLPPCHFGFKFYTRPLSDKVVDWRKGKGLETEFSSNNPPTHELSLLWYQRSVDIPLGLPFNIAFYGIMLEVFSRLTNMVPGELRGQLSDLHIYENQTDGVLEQLNKVPVECEPRLSIPRHVDYNIDIDKFLHSIEPEETKIEGYESRGRIKFPLSN